MKLLLLAVTIAIPVASMNDDFNDLKIIQNVEAIAKESGQNKFEIFKEVLQIVSEHKTTKELEKYNNEHSPTCTKIVQKLSGCKRSISSLQSTLCLLACVNNPDYLENPLVRR